MFRRVLVANRGEIAARITRGVQALGAEAVVATADDDASSIACLTADRIAHLGLKGPQAFLDASRLVRAAVDNGCDALHPGIGFLSESPVLARMCQQHGVAFVGPSAEALSLCGDKDQARLEAKKAGLPILPGAIVESKSAAKAAFGGIALRAGAVLKAISGGGGKGIRHVNDAAECDEAYERCASEASRSFADGRLLLERYVPRARHIEVQLLVDSAGQVAHLGDRDCSIQRRYQKIIEIAPAPLLHADLRAALHHDAVRFGEALVSSGMCGLATVEFLLDMDNHSYYFMECNPRLQVEATITEEISGVDLVSTQLRLIHGTSLSQLFPSPRSSPFPSSTHSPTAVCSLHGSAVQARVSATSLARIGIYCEPRGAGVRVDSAAFAGMLPHPSFDPLLAKVISHAASVEEALLKVGHAVRHFHIAGTGVTSNLPELSALIMVLEQPTALASLSTAFIADHQSAITAAAAADTSRRSERQDQAFGPQRLGKAAETAVSAAAKAEEGACSVEEQEEEGRCSVRAPAGEQVGVYAAGRGQCVSAGVKVGDSVEAGSPMLALSVMKMEEVVVAPVCGRVVSLLLPGERASASGLVAVLEPTITDEASSDAVGEASRYVSSDAGVGWVREIETMESMRRAALQLGGAKGVERQKAQGKLTVRERIAQLLDPNTFSELGALAGAATWRENDNSLKDLRAHSFVCGSGLIDARTVFVGADDFTHRAGHSEGSAALVMSLFRKQSQCEARSRAARKPMVRLLDGSSGGGSVATILELGYNYVPPLLGFEHKVKMLSEVPVACALLGPVVGFGAARAVTSHYSVMVKSISSLFVAGPPVVAALGEHVTKEQLGGAHIHAANGSVDDVVLSESEAFVKIGRFLSFLPSNSWELPPVLPSVDSPQRRASELNVIIPRNRRAVFDVRKLLALIIDSDTPFFEMGGGWGRSLVTGFARLDGRPVGVLASDSAHNGGALSADACRKLSRFVRLCDTFHLPVVSFVDQPGFSVGTAAEAQSTIRVGANAIAALYSLRSGYHAVIVRRAFGVGGAMLVDCGSAHDAGVNWRVAWPSAETGSLPLDGGVEAAFKSQIAAAPDPVAALKALRRQIDNLRSPLRTAAAFSIEDVIEPCDTRPLLCTWVREQYQKLAHGDTLGPGGGFVP